METISMLMIFTYIHYLQAYHLPALWPAPSWHDSSTGRALPWDWREVRVQFLFRPEFFRPFFCYCSSTITYRISSPISLAIFSVFDTEICEISHQKWGSAYSWGFGIKKKNCWIQWFYFLFGQHESVWRSLNIRVSAHSRDRLIGEEIQSLRSSLTLKLKGISCENLPFCSSLLFDLVCEKKWS